MIVVGINKIHAFSNLPHDSAAAIIADGEIIASAEEERFARKKHTRAFPIHALSYCLNTLGVTLSDIDYLAVGNNPYARFRNLHLELSASQAFHKLLGAFASTKEKYALQKLVKRGAHFVDHHRAHAASGYYGSGFSEANVLVIDSAGESESVSLFIGREGTLTLAWRMLINWDGMPSIGKLYGLVSKTLGFSPFQAGRTMALAPFGKPLPELLEIFSIKNHREWTANNKRLMALRNRFQRVEAEEPFSEIHKDLAAAAQLIAEQSVINLAREAYEMSRIKNFVLVGGVALNCNINTALLLQDFCDRLFTPAMANDSGIALGAALHISNTKDSYKPFRYTHSYFGPAYSSAQIERALRASGAQFSRHEHIEEKAAKLITSGHVIGWFQGRMELGPRALGNRSILADPTSGTAKERINGRIKKRELWRPFGPAVSQESAADYFDDIEKAGESPFMLHAFPLKEQYRSTFPAVTHIDGRCRIQTVNSEQNPRFYRLLKLVEKINGHAMLLNTSLNVDGEPIACSPDDAMRLFLDSELDALIIGDYVVLNSKSN